MWRLIAWVVSRPAIADWLIKRAQKTPYTHIIDPKTGKVYMGRWWLFNPYPAAEEQRAKGDRFPISIRIHNIRRPDTARDLHDHPWNARTIIIKGGYLEQRLDDDGLIRWYWRKPGDTAAIKFGQYHSIDRLDYETQEAWTIFITGKYRGTWGFLVDGVKVQWRKYLGVKP